MDFRNFVKLHERIQGMMTPDVINQWAPLGMVIPNGVFGAMPTQWTGSQQGDEPLSSGGFMGTNWLNGEFDLGLPSVSKTAQVKQISDKKNPIFVFLSDGTKLYIPFDSYKKINIEPQVGKTMMVTFQRRKEDGSLIPSKIQSIKCY